MTTFLVLCSYRLIPALAMLIGMALATRKTASAELTARQIVDRYITVRGGHEKIRAVRTLILRGPARPDGKPGRFMARARPYYFVVGEPTSPTRRFAEGFDGSAWEFYADPGVVLRTTDAPAAATHHTAYFDDPVVNSLEPGWTVELVGAETIGDRPTYWLRITFPDGFQSDRFVDKETFLVIADRKVAPIHAFGAAVPTETRISDYRDLEGALFPMRFDEFEIATGDYLEDMSGGWETVEVNVTLPLDYFSPPAEPQTPIVRLLNAIFAARFFPQEALGWYCDFRSNPATSTIDTEAGVEAVGYHCLKNGAVETGVLLLEATVRDYPGSAAAHFGLGRAYRAMEREQKAIAHFREALALDPTYKKAADALAQATGKK